MKTLRQNKSWENLVKIIVSEKSFKQEGSRQKITMIVKNNSNKKDIAQMIEKHLNVKVFNVRTMKINGTFHDVGKTRRKVGVGLQKKAIVTLHKDYNINLEAL